MQFHSVCVRCGQHTLQCVPWVPGRSLNSSSNYIQTLEDSSSVFKLSLYIETTFRFRPTVNVVWIPWSSRSFRCSSTCHKPCIVMTSVKLKTISQLTPSETDPNHCGNGTCTYSVSNKLKPNLCDPCFITVLKATWSVKLFLTCMPWLDAENKGPSPRTHNSTEQMAIEDALNKKM